MKVNEFKWSLKDNLRKFQAVENRWLLWKCVWQADLVYICVYLYTLSVYTHTIMLIHTICLEKNPDFPVFFLLLMCILENATLFSFY